MTTDITDQDEREAIAWAQQAIASAQIIGVPVLIYNIDLLRALLQRATRAHD